MMVNQDGSDMEEGSISSVRARQGPMDPGSWTVSASADLLPPSLNLGVSLGKFSNPSYIPEAKSIFDRRNLDMVVS